jgi:hypothetical protein
MCKKTNYPCAERVLMLLHRAMVNLAIGFLIFPWTSAVASDIRAQEDSQMLLERIRNKIKTHFSELHNYTCHLVINRMAHGSMSLGFDSLDTTNLEVAFVDNRELFARAGDSRFEERPIYDIMPGGMIGNDALGSHDDDVFSRDAVIFTFAGLCKKDGHKTFRYNFRVPQERSRLLVKQANSVGATVGYKGSFWVDAETLDMVRLEWKTEQIPQPIGLSSVTKLMRYKILKIGNSEFSLPQYSELASFDHAGTYRLNTISLSSCSEFAGESIVKYGAPANIVSMPVQSNGQR